MIKAGFIIARIIAIGLLIYAIGKHPYGYYKVIKFIVCAISCYGAYFSADLNRTGWEWIFGSIAVLFNPIIPFHLGRQTWPVVDLGVAIIFIISIFLVWNPNPKNS